MNKIKAFFLTLTLTCASLLNAATEKQEMIINKMHAFLQEIEEAHRKTFGSDENWLLIDSYMGLDDNDLETDKTNFLPIYIGTEDWETALSPFIQNELGLNPEEIEINDVNYDSVTLEKEGIPFLKIRKLYVSEASKFLRSTHLLCALHLKQLSIPQIEAIALYKEEDDTSLLIAQKCPQGIPLSNIVWGYESPNFKDLQARKWEELTEAYTALGKATTELYQATTHSYPIHPGVASVINNNLEQLQKELDGKTFVGLSFDELKQGFDAYQKPLYENLYPHSYGLSLNTVEDFYYDTATHTLSLESPIQVLSTINMQYRPSLPTFISYFKTRTKLLPPTPLNAENRALLKAAFDEGYVAAGGTLPSAEEEETYRFFADMQSIRTLLVPGNRAHYERLNWLYNFLKGRSE